MVGLLTILYRDDDLVVIDKPDGLLVHRTRIARDHVVALQLLRDQIGQLVYPVHRLDRPTSGALLFALSPDMAAAVCAGFASKEIAKTYLAVVRGITPESGTIELPLKDADSGIEQEAATRFIRVATAMLDVPVGVHDPARYSLLRVHPETGRMHQIRRHLKRLSHPVIGDTQHGDGRHNRFFRDRFGIRRLLLHGRRLEFTHPRTGEELAVEAPIPAEMSDLFQALGWQH